MDAWNPPKKHIYDLIETAAQLAALAAVAAAFLAIIILTI